MADAQPDDPPAELVPANEPPHEAPPRPGPEPEPAAEDVESTEHIGADSLRFDLRVIREMFGAVFTGITSHGATQYGSHNTQNNFYGEQPLPPTIGKLAGVDTLMAAYVDAGADTQLDHVLGRRSTACLVGPRNSGRYSTALAALARRHKPDNIYEIGLPTGVPPEALNRNPEEVAENSGFLLRLAGADHTDAMRKLGDLFRRRQSTLLLIKDQEPRQWERHDGEIEHRAPDPIKVFKSHLSALSEECSEDVDRYLTPDVERVLASTYGPKECVALAEAIAGERPSNHDELLDVIQRSQPKRRELAASIMLPGQDGRDRHRRTGQHERAFRLTYAVFRRRSLHYVFAATDILLKEIDSAALRPDWGNMALQHAVPSLLGERLGGDWKDGRDGRGDALGGSRVAWIRDDGLRWAMVDVAWHDFDGTRGALIRWLDRLVKEGDDVMRLAAAETAGFLAHHDFRRIYEELVDDWAVSHKPAVRQAAAWTMTIPGMSDDARPRVLAKLDEWCAGGSNKRDTAARVYASGLEQPVLAWSMFDLARIAADRYQKRHHVVAEAVNQLYRPERSGWIITELAGWVRIPLVQVHAARAVVVLAGRVASSGRPDLLERVAEETVDVGHLAALWQAAFLEPGTAPSAAGALARWIRHADTFRESRRYVVALLNEIAKTGAMRRRVDFYLTNGVELRHGMPQWAEKRRWEE